MKSFMAYITESSVEIAVRQSDTERVGEKKISAVIKKYKLGQPDASDKDVAWTVKDRSTAERIKKDLKKIGVNADVFIDGET